MSVIWCVPGLSPVVIGTPAGESVADNWRRALTGPVNVVSPDAKGTYDMIAPIPTRDISADIEAWRVELQRKRRSADYLTRGPRLVRELADRFGWSTSGEATTAQLSEWLGSIDGSGHSSNNRVAMLRAYFRFCLKTLNTVGENPAANLERAAGHKQDGVREFTAAEMRALYRAAEGPWRTAVGIMATTALRRSAVFKGIRCGWVDLPRRLLVIPAGVLKNRRAQSIPLNDDALEILRVATLGREPSAFVVPIRPDQRAWDRLRYAAGIARRDERGRACGFHSFRKGVLTLIAEGGAHPKTAQDLAGHSDIRLTMGVYTQMNVKNQADALKKLPRLNPHGTGVCDHGEEVLREMFLDSDPERADAVGANRKETGVMLSKTQPSANERPDAVSENDSHSSKSSTPGRSFTLACENPARSNTDGVEFAGRSAGVNGQAGIAFPTTGENADDALAPSHLPNPTQTERAGLRPVDDIAAQSASLPWRRSGSSSAPAMSRLPTRPL